MALTPGTRIGPYEVGMLLGAGGMGEVYRGRDTKLNRDVALKVLSPAFAGDAERMARFQREAQLLAALSHPNIAAVYGIEDTALVMEYIPGETLQGPLPVDEAMNLARQIADALDCAHEKGIIHRDLKPANIKVTPEGKVKVLDFGLAKALADDPSSTDNLSSPTLSVHATKMGVILGTAAYMSPEQARGKPVDRRTDIWAFGAVLYEMLTGARAFPGETASDSMAAILAREPDWSALPPGSPVKLLRKCLEKDPAKRLRHIGDIFYIDDAPSGISAGPSPAAAAAPAVRPASRWLVAALAVTALALIASVAWNLRPSPAPQVRRLAVSLTGGEHLGTLTLPVLALSPDGNQLVYVGVKGQGQQLYWRALDSYESKPIPGTEGATSPFFSPDGQWVGFFAELKMKKVALAGGTPAVITAVQGIQHNSSWSEDGRIVFNPGNQFGPFSVVPASGGKPEPFSVLKDDFVHRWPSFLPDNRGLLFAGSKLITNWNESAVEVWPKGEKEPRVLYNGGTSPSYAASGHLLYAHEGALVAAPLNLRDPKPAGAPVQVIDGVAHSMFTGAAQYSLSRNGTLAYVAGGVWSMQQSMVWVDRNGVESPLPSPPRAYRFPRLSPDGTKIAMAIDDSVGQVWVYDLLRGVHSRLATQDNASANTPAWTPDGKRIVHRQGATEMVIRAADGSDMPQRLSNQKFAMSPAGFTPDGKVLIFTYNTASGYDIMRLDMESRRTEPFLTTTANESAPALSPDGHRIAYISDESGKWEIYVQAFPEKGDKLQLSVDGGTEPLWNRNGKEIFYRNGDKLMAVDVTSSPQFTAGKPRLVFERAYVRTPATFPNYVVSADGKRFLMLKPSQEQNITQINVVLNFFEELKRRVPVK